MPIESIPHPASDPNDFVEIPGEKKMAAVADIMNNSMVDGGILNVSLSGMASSFSAQADSRQKRFDQLAADAGAMWSIAMTTPTVNAGLGYRTVVESGAGRTRAETNNPGNTAAPGGGT